MYLKDVVLAANDEQRERKGADHLSVLVATQQSTSTTSSAAAAAFTAKQSLDCCQHWLLYFG